MKTRLTHGVIGCLAVVLILPAAQGCRKEQPAQEEPAKKAVGVERATGADVTAAVEAKLAEADKLDGNADKIVSKCASCALGMDGKSDHALEVSGYTLHFCREECKTGFEKDANKAILALKIPEG